MSRKAVIISAVVIVVAVVVLAAISFLLMSARIDGDACIYSDGKLLYRIDLDAVTEPYELVIECDGGSNTVRVEHGRICVIDADCPDKTCVNTGWLSDDIIPIICIPHRLEIRLEQSSGLDGVSQ